ncbi:DUF4055 domain-containing protein [uncultured Desulfovibrio sp.]|uniref:DUF4055 domain-containing protein n=1 Tax=uncultured Desulfovibrio sp. TaxID=167968 RepID=UPI00260A8BA5|nr:DUF4055 domain-containing protein [uncultured Desulfovibrio sp.]
MSDDVDSISDAFTLQREDMALPHDLMGGTKAMLRAGQRYIPQEYGEDRQDWQIRLNRTILFNVYKRTLRYLSGRVFEKPVVLGEDVKDSRFEEFIENVDRLGRNLTVWGRHVFETGLNDGVTFCVVDFNSVNTRRVDGKMQYQREDGSWADKTEAADRENGWGPYFIHVEAGRVLDARLEWKNDQPRITHFRYIETVEEQDGKWGTRTYERIRAFYLDENKHAHWELWNNSSKNGGTDSWTPEAKGVFSAGVLPVVVFIPGEKRTPLTAEPALIDLAQLNKRHWQATCAQYELMEYVRRPPWFGRNLGEFDADTGREKVIFGAGKLCHSKNPDAVLQSVGVDAGSVAAGRQELEDLENRMAIYGLQLLQPKTGVITATESQRDAEENNSTLKAWALQFQDFLENCMALTAKWWKLPDGPSVKVNTEFANAFDASFLMEMYRAQVISGQTLLALVKNMGILPDDFNVEDEAAKIAGGLMVNGTGAAGLAQSIKMEGIL